MMNSSALPFVGWRETVMVPALADTLAFKAKVDTGATTSAIHVEDLELHEGSQSQAYASFSLNMTEEPDDRVSVVRHPVVAYRFVRSSSGHGSYRPVIRTALCLGTALFDIDITLTGRDQMGFKMLIGRAALRGRFHVDPNRSFVQREPNPA